MRCLVTPFSKGGELYGAYKEGLGVEPQAGSRGTAPGGVRGTVPLKLKVLYTFIQKGPKDKDLNEMIQSKIYTFMLLNWPIGQNLIY